MSNCNSPDNEGVFRSSECLDNSGLFAVPPESTFAAAGCGCPNPEPAPYLTEPSAGCGSSSSVVIDLANYIHKNGSPQTIGSILNFISSPTVPNATASNQAVNLSQVPGTTDALVEGTVNLYFTNTRAIGAILTGYTSGAGVVSSTDSTLQAIQKLNGNIAALVTGVSSFNTRTGAVTPLVGDYSAFYQPLEDQRLSTNDDILFNSVSAYAGGTPITTITPALIQVQDVAHIDIAPTSITLNDGHSSTLLLNTATLSGTHTQTFKNATGIIALTSDIPSTLPPTGSAGGDLTGTYPNPTITTINSITKTYYDPTSSIQTQLNSKIGLTALSATSPIFYNNSTGIISSQAATTSVSGYLTSTDWNTFNNKQPSGNYITALTGEATASGPGSTAITLTNSAVISKVLTGYVSGAGTVSTGDSILQAIQKLNGNIGALITGVSSVTGTANRIIVTPTTGNVVVDISSSYVGQTSITTVGTITTGTWSGLFGAITGANLTSLTAANISAGTAGINISGNSATVTTNANLTGPVTSSGNATSIANGAITNAMLANGAVANLSGTNTGDNSPNSLYSGLVTMTYPGAGIPISTGSAWGTSITDNHTNWNTAFGWGNWASNFGTGSGTIAQGNDSRINDGEAAFGWGNPSGVYLKLSTGGTVSGGGGGFTNISLTGDGLSVNSNSSPQKVSYGLGGIIFKDGTSLATGSVSLTNVFSTTGSWLLPSDHYGTIAMTGDIPTVGATNFVQKSNGTNLINSLITDDGSTVTIGTSADVTGAPVGSIFNTLYDNSATSGVILGNMFRQNYTGAWTSGSNQGLENYQKLSGGNKNIAIGIISNQEWTGTTGTAVDIRAFQSGIIASSTGTTTITSSNNYLSSAVASKAGAASGLTITDAYQFHATAFDTRGITYTNKWSFYGDSGSGLLKVLDGGIFGSTLTSVNNYSTSATPSISAGVAAGTSPTVTIAGTNQDGKITITTGTSPTTGILCTITLSGGFSYPNLCTPVFSQLTFSTPVTVSLGSCTANSFQLYIPTTALSASNAYTWNYHNGGY